MTGSKWYQNLKKNKILKLSTREPAYLLEKIKKLSSMGKS